MTLIRFLYDEKVLIRADNAQIYFYYYKFEVVRNTHKQNSLAWHTAVLANAQLIFIFCHWEEKKKRSNSILNEDEETN